MGTVSSLLYCTAYGKPQSVFYMVMSGISFFILFLSGNIIVICMMGVLFLLIPVIFVPTAELIKRDMHLFFLLFFLLRNMLLVTNYTGWVKAELAFDIMTSIYIDLALLVTAVCYLQYWEKIPDNIDTRHSVMKKLQKAYSFMLKITGIFFLVILLAGEKLTWIRQSWGIAGLQGFASMFQQCYLNNKGTAFDILGEYGILGFVLFLIIAVIIIKSLKWKYHKEDVQGTILTVIVYLVQSLFLGQQLVTTPIYVILLTLA